MAGSLPSWQARNALTHSCKEVSKPDLQILTVVPFIDLHRLNVIVANPVESVLPSTCGSIYCWKEPLTPAPASHPIRISDTINGLRSSWTSRLLMQLGLNKTHWYHVDANIKQWLLDRFLKWKTAICLMIGSWKFWARKLFRWKSVSVVSLLLWLYVKRRN